MSRILGSSSNVKQQKSLIQNVDHNLKTLKFRSFVSKEQQGFVIIFDCDIPEIIFEDILFQLFEPIFKDLPCPDIYYFSSTDQIMTYSQMISMKDYIYVHFLQRVQQYEKLQIFTKKLKLGDLDRLAHGISFQGANLFIISQKYYMMYGHELFYNNMVKKIQQLPSKLQRKQIKYEQYNSQIINLKDNLQFVALKKEIDFTMQDMTKKLRKLQDIANRYSKARNTLKNILKESGINIQGINDLF